MTHGHSTVHSAAEYPSAEARDELNSLWFDWAMDEQRSEARYWPDNLVEQAEISWMKYQAAKLYWQITPKRRMM